MKLDKSVVVVPVDLVHKVELKQVQRSALSETVSNALRKAFFARAIADAHRLVETSEDILSMNFDSVEERDATRGFLIELANLSVNMDTLLRKLLNKSFDCK